MQTLDLIKEIKRLPIANRFLVVEEIIKSIKEEKAQNQMEFAVNELYEEYVSNPELTMFTTSD